MIGTVITAFNVWKEGSSAGARKNQREAINVLPMSKTARNMFRNEQDPAERGRARLHDPRR